MTRLLLFVTILLLASQTIAHAYYACNKAQHFGMSEPSFQSLSNIGLSEQHLFSTSNAIADPLDPKNYLSLVLSLRKAFIYKGGYIDYFESNGFDQDFYQYDYPNYTQPRYSFSLKFNVPITDRHSISSSFTTNEFFEATAYNGSRLIYTRSEFLRVNILYHYTIVNQLGVGINIGAGPSWIRHELLHGHRNVGGIQKHEGTLAADMVISLVYNLGLKEHFFFAADIISTIGQKYTLPEITTDGQLGVEPVTLPETEIRLINYGVSLGVGLYLKSNYSD